MPGRTRNSASEASDPAVPSAAVMPRVREGYAATVPGLFLYFPSRAQSSPALRLFVRTAKELAISPPVNDGG